MKMKWLNFKKQKVISTSMIWANIFRRSVMKQILEIRNLLGWFSAFMTKHVRL